MTEKQITELKNKIKTLKFRLSKTDDIVAKRDRQALQRQRTSITNIVCAVDSLKSVIEEKKFAKGDSEDDIAAWSEEVEGNLERADETVRRVETVIKVIDNEELEKQAVEKHKLKMEFERELLEQKAEFESKQEQKASSQTAQQLKLSSVVKLPKLSITKFNGRIEEWLPFWGKFISEIDSTDLAPLTKFGYLKELL